MAQTRENENLGFCFESGSISPGRPVVWKGKLGHSVTSDLHRMSYVISVKAPNEAMGACIVPEPLESATMLGMRRCQMKDLDKGYPDPTSIFEPTQNNEIIVRDSVPHSISNPKPKKEFSSTK